MSARRAACPVCLRDDLNCFLERQGVPIFENVLFKYRTDALNVERGDLRMVACVHCGFIFNADYDPSRALYGEGYNNNQTCSPEFRNHLNGRVARIADLVPVGSTIVEVGSGSGWFLEHLVPRIEGSRGFGFDPAYAGPDETCSGRIRYHSRYFGAEDAALRADVGVCRHVIEHVADPVGLLRAVRAALESSPRPRVFFETPCVEWILRNQVIWDFFYEHCSYFDQSSLRTGFERAGFAVERIEHVFGGQYLWLEAVPKPASTHPANVDGVLSMAVQFKEANQQLISRRKAQVAQLRTSGNVAVWGAGAKGVTFLNLIDPHASLIDCIVDIDPLKQQRFVGGTGHEVVSVAQLAGRNVTSAVLMNPNYREENLRLLAQAGATVQLID
jgi:hypothetical protein